MLYTSILLTVAVLLILNSHDSLFRYPHTNRACWKMPTLSSENENAGVGSLRARFEVTNGPSSHVSRRQCFLRADIIDRV